MAIANLFSNREARESSALPELYEYDIIPKTLRVQIIYILRDALGVRESFKSYPVQEIERLYKFVYQTLCKEYGVFSLDTPIYFGGSTSVGELEHFLHYTDTDIQCLDVVDFMFRIINTGIRNDENYISNYQPKQTADDAIAELNFRFREAGVGYQFEKDANRIIRVDNQFIHNHATKPALQLLYDQKFKGAQDEFILAHEAYKEGRSKDCLVECLKAFESTMKTICDNKGWAYNLTDPAKKLIQVCFSNGLIPPALQAQFTSLQQIFDSGVPTIRNKNAGHGQGSTPKTPEDELVRYTLNLTASNIVFLVELAK